MAILLVSVYTVQILLLVQSQAALPNVTIVVVSVLPRVFIVVSSVLLADLIEI